MQLIAEKAWFYYFVFVYYTMRQKELNMKKIVIFDLDGTLALIDKRRDLATKDNGKFDWDVFFDPANIDLDLPNQPVIDMANLLSKQGYTIMILSGRSDVTHQATRDWLNKHGVWFDTCLLYTSPSPRDLSTSRMPSSA